MQLAVMTAVLTHFNMEFLCRITEVNQGVPAAFDRGVLKDSRLGNGSHFAFWFAGRSKRAAGRLLAVVAMLSPLVR